MGLSITHLLVVAAVVVLLFGGSRLGDLGKGLGNGIRNFKQGLQDDDVDDNGRDSLTEGSK